MLTRGYQGDPYAALGLEEGASAASIRAAFRRQARVLHPDVSDDPMSAAKFCALCAAVEAIQSEPAFAKVSRAANVDVPPGLSDDERVRWLIAKNKVLLFMRGTKQKPLCDESASMVATLSWVAFDTDTHFTAVNVAVDAPLGEAALRVARTAGMTAGGASSAAVLPLCFIDGSLVGSSDEVDELYESGELMRAFGGEMLVEPRELEWSGARVHEDGGGEGGRGPRRRAHRNLVSGNLEWYVEHPDGFWRSEKDVAEDGQAIGLQQPVGRQQGASPASEAPEAEAEAQAQAPEAEADAPEAGTPEATGARGVAAAAAAAAVGAAGASAGAAGTTMIEEV